MSEVQHKIRRQKKDARLDIVAELRSKGYSLRAIRAELMKRLDLKTYSLKS